MGMIFFSGSLIFWLLGALAGVGYLILRNASFYMVMPLLVILTGLSPEMAVPIALAHMAALLIPAAVGHWQSGNVDFKLLLTCISGILIGDWLINGVNVPILHWAGQSYFILLPYLLLFLGAMVHRVRPFPLLPKPNHKVRKKLLRLIATLPGKTNFTASEIQLPFYIPILMGVGYACVAKLFGPVVALLTIPILLVCCDVPVLVASGTASLLNLCGMLLMALTSDFIVSPLNLQILLWLFLGSTMTVFSLSFFLPRKLYPIPVAAVLVAITSFTLLALSASFPTYLLGWFGGMQG